MFVYTIVKGDSFEVVAVSPDIEKLRGKMKVDVQDYLDCVYGGKTEPYGLVPVSQVDDFWRDDSEFDGSYMEFHIFEVPVM